MVEKTFLKYRKPFVANYELNISHFRSSDKPPTDHKERKLYFKLRDKYFRDLKWYGNSLVGGFDKAKSITVKEEVPNKKEGKEKDGKTVGIFVIIKLLSKLFPQ